MQKPAPEKEVRTAKENRMQKCKKCNIFECVNCGQRLNKSMYVMMYDTDGIYGFRIISRILRAVNA